MNILDLFRKTKQGENNNAVNDGGQKQQVSEAQQAATEPQEKTEAPQEKAAEEPKTAAKDGKAHVYNLIIVDESGSMSHLREATLSGVNETINTVRQAQKELKETQKHYLTLITFDSPGFHNIPVRTLIDTKPIDEVKEFTDYEPCGCTPLYDAMGQSITHLYQQIKGDEDATAIVSVMTDGLENASREFGPKQLKELIEKLKEEGWTFNYMGSAHDVKSVCDLLSIENVVEFSHDERGTQATWARERSSRKRLFEKMSCDWESMKERSAEEKRQYRKRNSSGYYDK